MYLLIVISYLHGALTMIDVLQLIATIIGIASGIATLISVHALTMEKNKTVELGKIGDFFNSTELRVHKSFCKS